MKKKIHFSLLLCLLFLSVGLKAQVAIVESFETGIPDGWTSSGFDQTANFSDICDGSAAVRENQYNQYTSLATLTTPEGISNGEDLNISFDWKSRAYGSNTDYGMTGEVFLTLAGNTGLLGTFSANGPTDCASFTATVPGGFLPEGATIQMEVRTTHVSGDYWVALDNFSLTQATGAVPNCDAVLSTTTDVAAEGGSISWSNATGAPTGYKISIGSTAGGTDIANNVDVGNTTSYNLPNLSYETTYYTTITPYSAEGDATDCTEQTFITEVDLATTVICGETTNQVYCYENSDNTAFIFRASDPNQLLKVIFNSGGTEVNWDELIVYDGGNTDATQLYNGYGNGGDLTGLTFTSTGDAIVVQVTSDGFGNCTGVDGSRPQWDFDVVCVNPAAALSCVELTSATTDFGISGSSLTWNEPSTGVATGYTVSVGTTSGGTDVVDNVTATGTSYTFASDLDYSTTYYVSVVPYNDNGSASDCTEFTFTTEADPAILVTCGETTNQVYCYGANDNTSFVFTSSDPNQVLQVVFNSGAVENNWDELIIYDGNNTNAAQLYNGYGNSGDLTGFNITSTGDAIVVQVTSDGSGNCSGEDGFRPQWDFDVVCIDPMVVPSCVAVDVAATDFSVSGGVITWSAPTGAVVSGYTLSVGTTSGGTDVVDNATVTGTSYTIPNTLDYSTMYYVSVVPFNDSGSASDCTEASFTTEADPAVIVTCGETTNQVYCYGDNDNTSFTFVSSDPDQLLQVVFNSGGVENTYDELVVYDGSNTGATQLYNGYGDAGDLTGLSFISTGASITLQVTSDVSVSCTGEDGARPQWNFDVVCVDPNTLPSCVSLTTTTDVAISNGTLSWTASEGVADSYTLSVGTTSGGTDIVDNVSVTGSTSYTLPELEYSTTYYATVVPVNNALGSPEDCTEETFVTEADPTITVTCGESVNQTYCYGNNDNTSFTFVSSDPDQLLQIVFNSGGTESSFDELIVFDGNNTSATELYNGYGDGGNLTGLSFISTGASITLQVTSDGSVSCTGEDGARPQWDFDVVCVDPNGLPSCVTLTTTTDVEISGGVLSWAAEGVIDGYTLSVGTTSGGTDVVDNVSVVGATSYDLPALDYETTYYTTIVPYNSAGAAEDCTEQTFVTEDAPVAGAICETAIEVSSLPFTATGNTGDYGDDYGSGDNPCSSTLYLNGDDVVYSYTPTEDMTINVKALGMGIYSGVFVFNGCPFTSCVSQSVGSAVGDKEIFELPVTAGTTYYIVISTWPTPQATDYTLVIEEFTCLPATVGSFTTDRTNCGDGTVDVSFSVTDMGTATELVVTNDKGGVNPVNITATGTYTITGIPTGLENVTISVTNADDGTCVATGEASIECAPTNDECAAAVDLTANINAGAVLVGSNRLAETDGVNPFTTNDGNTFLSWFNGNPAYNDVWFKVTPTVECMGFMTVSSLGSTFDTKIAIYDDCGGTVISGNDDYHGVQASYTSLTTAAVESGKTYYIQVAGYGTGSRGSVTLDISMIDNGCSQVVTCGGVESADLEFRGADGWTHYVNTSTGNVILSVNKNGNDIGYLGIDDGFEVSVAAGQPGSPVYRNLGNADDCVASYGSTANDIVMNRTWSITPNVQPTSDVGVRFYFNTTDFAGVNMGLEANGMTMLNAEKDMKFFQVTGASAHFSDNACHAAGTYQEESAVVGDSHGLHYGEFTTGTLNGGSAHAN